MRFLLIHVTSLVCAITRVRGANTTRDEYSRKISVCDFSYGTPLHQLENARSFLACTVECMNTEQCQSLTHDPVTKLCKFNREPWSNPTTSGCLGDSVFYTQMKTACTIPVNNVRLCDGGGTGVSDLAQGRLEVYHENTWGTVCDDKLMNYDDQLRTGTIYCATLGYTSGVALLEAPFGEGWGPIWLDGVVCDGTETSLFQCPHNGWGVHNCQHREDVGVLCA